MTLQQLKYILAISKFKTMTKAAEKCHVTHGTISQGVSSFESYYRVKLFNRRQTAKGVCEPTEIGAEIIPKIQKMIDLADSIKREMSNQGDRLICG